MCHNIAEYANKQEKIKSAAGAQRQRRMSLIEYQERNGQKESEKAL